MTGMPMAGPRAPIIVLNQSTTTSSSAPNQTLFNNINAAKRTAELIRTCLGPRAALKMLMDPMGGICMTNDGNAILREITVQHPAAKSLIEIARTQDEEVGDGTTSVIVLAGEIMAAAQQFVEQKMHPTVIIRGFRMALEDMLKVLDDIEVKVDLADHGRVKEVIKSCLATKFLAAYSDLAVDIAFNAVKHVTLEEHGRREIDIKRYVKVEKIPGGRIEDSYVMKGIILNKDVVHPSRMSRRVENPRILLLDCTLEYKKGESMTNVELFKEEDFTRMLKMEEEYIEKVCGEIAKLKPDVVVTEKGISDLAIHFLSKANITALRRLKKSDNNRLSRATGATIVNRTDELREEDIGTGCTLFEVKKIGDEYFSFFECKEPKACSVVLRGASRDVLKEVERNLQDALCATRSLFLSPSILPGGGATELAIATRLMEKSKSLTSIEQYPYRAAAEALEVIPRTLAQNCGASVIRVLTKLRAKQAVGDSEARFWGINGTTGEPARMDELGVWEPREVKAQVLKTAIETGILLLRIDDVVSGGKKKKDEAEASGVQQAGGAGDE